MSKYLTKKLLSGIFVRFYYAVATTPRKVQRQHKCVYCWVLVW